MSGFKPKSIEELNAAFEQKLALSQEEREQTSIDEDLLSEEQKEFYRVVPVQEETQEIPEEYIEQEQAVEEPQIQEEIYEEPQIQEEIYEEPVEVIQEEPIYEQEMEEVPAETFEQVEEPEEVNELFEAERISQQEAELYEANSLAYSQAAAESEQTENNQQEYFIEQYEYEETQQEEPFPMPENNTFYFRESAEQLQEESQPIEQPVQETSVQEEPVVNEAPTPKVQEEVKLTRHEDVKKNKKAEKVCKHRTAKTVFNTLISIVVLICIFVNGVVFMADMPRRFLGGYGITVCEHTVEGSNVESGYLLITKKTKVAADDKIVAALTKDKKVTVDFKQNIPEDAQVYSQAVKVVRWAGGWVKYLRIHWIESACAELAVLLVLLIARVAVSDKKAKPESEKKNEETKKKDK